MSSTSLMFAFIVLVLGAVGIAAVALQRREERRDAEAASAEAYTALWRERPFDALQARWQRFLIGLRRLRAAAEERRDRATAAEERRDRYRQAVRGGRPVTPVYVAVVSALGAFWLVVFVLQIVLDCLILKGLHPNGVILPLALGTVAALGIAGLALLLVVVFGGHEGIIPIPRSRNAKRLIGLFGGAVLVIIVGILVVVAPARSQLTDGRTVTDSEKLLAQATAQDPVDPLAVEAAKADLAAARTRLAHAEAVDRAYALLTPTFEVALSVPAVAAAELLMLTAASRRARRRRREAKAAEAEEGGALDAWTADATDELIRFGHGQEVLDTFLARLNRSRQPPGSASEPGAPSSATPNGPEAPGQAHASPTRPTVVPDAPGPQPPPARSSRIDLTAVSDQRDEPAVDPGAAQPDDSEWDESA